MRFRLLALIALVLGLSRMALSAEMTSLKLSPPATASPAVSVKQPLKVTSNSKRKFGRFSRLKRSWRERFVRRAPAAKPQVPLLPPPPPPLAFDMPSIIKGAWQDRIQAEAYIPGVTAPPPAAMVRVGTVLPEPTGGSLIPKPVYWTVEYVAASALAQTQDARFRGDASPQLRYRFRL